MKTIRLHIKGMTCTSCEIIIERALRKVKGVSKVEVSMARREAKIEADDDVNVDNLTTALQGTTYLVCTTEGCELSGRHKMMHGSRRDDGNKKEIVGGMPGVDSQHLGLWRGIGRGRWRRAGRVALVVLAVLLMAFALYSLISARGWGSFGEWSSGFTISENMSYWLVFVIGLIASTSTCLAVSGGLLLAFAASYSEQHPNVKGWAKFKPHIFFNLGRLISYALFGALIGLIGSVFTFSTSVNGLIVTVASLLMIVIGLQLLHVPPFSKIRLPTLKGTAHRAMDTKHSGSELWMKIKASALGAVTFFLPCGFTQALQLYVLSKGSMALGSLTMLVFALGTLPALMGVGVISSFSTGGLRKKMITLAATIVIILGVISLSAGLSLMGVMKSSDNNKEMAYLDAERGVQIINMSIVGLEYEPSSFAVREGIPVEWNIEVSKAEGCAVVVNSKELGIEILLSSGSVTTINFTPSKVGEFPFSCGMGMAGPGTIEVVKDDYNDEIQTNNRRIEGE